MEERTYFTSKIGTLHRAWHVALEPGSSKMQDVIVPLISFEDFEMISLFLSSEHVKAAQVKSEDGGYLLMYDGKSQRPYPSIIIWRYQTDEETKGNLITDMTFDDAPIIEYVWKNYLIEEGGDQEFIKPNYYIFMEKDKDNN